MPTWDKASDNSDLWTSIIKAIPVGLVQWGKPSQSWATRISQGTWLSINSSGKRYPLKRRALENWILEKDRGESPHLLENGLSAHKTCSCHHRGCSNSGNPRRNTSWAKLRVPWLWSYPEKRHTDPAASHWSQHRTQDVHTKQKNRSSISIHATLSWLLIIELCLPHETTSRQDPRGFQLILRCTVCTCFGWVSKPKFTSDIMAK